MRNISNTPPSYYKSDENRMNIYFICTNTKYHKHIQNIYLVHKETTHSISYIVLRSGRGEKHTHKIDLYIYLLYNAQLYSVCVCVGDKVHISRGKGEQELDIGGKLLYIQIVERLQIMVWFKISLGQMAYLLLEHIEIINDNSNE